MFTLQTDRLTLRRVTLDDAPDVFAYMSKPEVVCHMVFPPFTSIEEALERIAWYDSMVNEDTGIRWGITLTGQDKVIGSCGFLNVCSKHDRAAIEVALSSAYWGKEITNEAFAAVLNYGFTELGFHRIEAFATRGSSPSSRFLNRHDFTIEGFLRGYEFRETHYEELCIYSLLKTDRMN